MTLLFKPILGATELGEAFGINDQGQVVGVSGGGAFLWQKGRVTYLGTLQKTDPQDRNAANRALAINNRGQIVGTAVIDAAGMVAHPFLWQSGRMTDLGTPRGTSGGAANAINDRGEVVGVAYGSIPKSVAWWWRQGRMQVLPDLPEAQGSQAEAINDYGQIVGQSGHRATVWQAGKPHDLNDLIVQGRDWLLEDATGTNEQGEIVGYGTHNGKQRAFLMTPIAAKY